MMINMMVMCYLLTHNICAFDQTSDMIVDMKRICWLVKATAPTKATIMARQPTTTTDTTITKAMALRKTLLLIAFYSYSHRRLTPDWFKHNSFLRSREITIFLTDEVDCPPPHFWSGLKWRNLKGGRGHY